MAKPTSVDSYISQFPPDIQLRLQQIRAEIKQQAPDIIEFIGYGIAAFKRPDSIGIPPIYLAAFTNHIGMYPLPKSGSSAFTKELRKYQTGKGTVHFMHDQPLPMPFIQQFINKRLAEHV